MSPSPDHRASAVSLLRRAVLTRSAAGRDSREPVLLPLAGGAGSLLRRADGSRLVSLVDGGEPARRGAVAGALVRLQARRSRVLLVPDRATGIRLAQAWRVELARVRVLEEGADPAGAARRHLARAGEAAQPWHAG